MKKRCSTDHRSKPRHRSCGSTAAGKRRIPGGDHQYRPAGTLPDAVAALKADGAEFYWFSGDLGSSADRARIAREAVQTLGEIRILVNNAGVAPKTRTDLLEMTEESYDRVLGVNTKGSMFFTQLIAKHMIGLSMEGRGQARHHRQRFVPARQMWCL